ncbi:MAG: acylphosphatase [Bifidobacteriaceae bacterium]|jgi:acylphosphatase|nr:acylphosphatase [Bifidobacteriaceae bacterium]
MVKYTITISGRVQGVGFRFTTLLIAEKLKIVGNVHNEYNGDVTIQTVCTEEQLQSLMDELKSLDARWIRIDHITVAETPDLPNFRDFRIR